MHVLLLAELAQWLSLARYICQRSLKCAERQTCNARYERLAGRELAPPSGDTERLKQWLGLLPCELSLTGHSWKNSSSDIAIAGAICGLGNGLMDAWVRHILMDSSTFGHFSLAMSSLIVTSAGSGSGQALCILPMD